MGVCKIDKMKRLDRMTRLMAFKSREEAIETCMAEFSIKRSTAMKWHKDAEKLILERANFSREKWWARTIHQLDVCIAESKGPDRLRAIAQRTALIGLNAPKRLIVTQEVVYRKPDDFNALRNPELRAAALALSVMHERLRTNGQGNGGSDQARLSGAASIEPGDVSLSRLSISGPSSGAGNGRNGNDVQPGKE